VIPKAGKLEVRAGLAARGFGKIISNARDSSAPDVALKVVWVARQSEPVKRKVALKLIKAGMDSRAVLQRFEQKRQALALMDHPNIAKVLDAGLTPGSQPFFLMDGKPGRQPACAVEINRPA
jgi:serine/threonine protein kinase